MNMRIDMQEIGAGPVLAGAINGRATLSRLIERLTQEPNEPTLLFLDFGTIDVATASHLRESVLAFRDYVRAEKPVYYPVIANANVAVKDELLELMKSRRDVIMSCRFDHGAVSEPAPIGELEVKQQLTFDLVRKHGETDAANLMRSYGVAEGTTRTTAWNNRLTSLAQLGLVIEESRGRAKRYRPLFEEN
jgi:hypothetical protein